MGDGTPNEVTPERTDRTIRFFSFWFEWLRTPARRQAALRLTGLQESGSAILHRLEQTGPMSVSALARSLSLDHSTVSRQLEPLRAAGLVDEAPFEHNRRSTRVSISSRGQVVSNNVDRFWREYWTRVLSHLSPEEQDRLTTALGHLQQAIDAEEATFDEAVGKLH